MAGSLSRHQRTRCHRLSWVFERTGWALMALIVAGAVAGFFGGGSLSFVDVSAGEALVARYPRFARANAPLDLAVEWTARQGDATIWISRAYLDQFAVEELLPTPSGTTLDSERIYYTFRTQSPDDRIRVVFRLRPDHGGRLTGSLGVDAEATLELRQLIFP
jgi:protein-L-isoaspartate(D-aspartate) O-methyltransferase